MSLVGIPPKVVTSLLRVPTVIMVGQFRLFFRDQVVDLQVLQMLVSKYQVIWVEAQRLVPQARVVVLVYPYLLISSQAIGDVSYVMNLSMSPRISLDVSRDTLSRILNFTFSLL